MMQGASLVFAGLHPSAVELQPVAEGVASLWRRYGAGRLLTMPAFHVRRIGQHLDMWSQATGIEIDNLTGVKVLRPGAALLGWAQPRVQLPAVAAAQA